MREGGGRDRISEITASYSFGHTAYTAQCTVQGVARYLYCMYVCASLDMGIMGKPLIQGEFSQNTRGKGTERGAHPLT